MFTNEPVRAKDDGITVRTLRDGEACVECGTAGLSCRKHLRCEPCSCRGTTVACSNMPCPVCPSEQKVDHT